MKSSAEMMIQRELEKNGDLYSVVICPVCKSKTLDNYWVCPVCLWEYDASAEDEHSSCNGMILREYREKFEKELKERI